MSSILEILSTHTWNIREKLFLNENIFIACQNTFKHDLSLDISQEISDCTILSTIVKHHNPIYKLECFFGLAVGLRNHSMIQYRKQIIFWFGWWPPKPHNAPIQRKLWYSCFLRQNLQLNLRKLRARKFYIYHCAIIALYVYK